MLVIGLTGGIASGKSTVSSLLSNKHHLPIIDADHLARAVIEPGTRGYKQVLSHFGPRILQPDGITFNRQAISEIVFNDEKERRALNGIIHPAVRRAIVTEVVRCWLRGEWACVLDVPLLIEAGLFKWVGEIVVVYVNESLQQARLLARPSPNPNEPLLTLTQAQSRIKSQMPLTKKLTFADHVLDNSGTKPELEAQLDALITKLRGGSDGWRRYMYWLVPPVGLWVGLVTVMARAWRRKVKRDKEGKTGKKGKDR